MSGMEERRHSLLLTPSIFESDFRWLDPGFSRLSGSTTGVQQYQRRNFTYDYDVLNAFRGFLSIIKMRSYWGVPILSGNMGSPKYPLPLCTRLGFAFGLLWHVTRRITKIVTNDSFHGPGYLRRAF